MNNLTLHLAIQDADFEAVKGFIHRGEKLNELDTIGFSPLHWAVFGNSIAMVEMLLQAKANPNVLSIEGVTPAWEAAKLHYTNIKQLLFSYGGMIHINTDFAKQTIKVINNPVSANFMSF